MNQKLLFVGAILLFCGAVRSDEVNNDNDNYYLNGYSIEQEEPIGTRREGEYYDAYPGQTYSSDTKVVDRQDPAEAALVSVVPGIAALLGVIVLAWVQANDQNNQQNQIDNICSSVRATGNTALTLTTISDLTGDSTATTATNGEILGRLNLIETAINAFTTPGDSDCN